MNKHDMFTLMGDLDDRYIQEAEKVMVHKKNLWIKTVAAAAAVIAILTLSPALFRRKGTVQPGNEGFDDDGLLEGPAILEMNSCYYEVTDSEDAMRKKGIRLPLTQEEKGGHVAYLSGDPENGYQLAVSESDAELFTYKPAECRGAYIVEDSGKLYAALFCNFIFEDDTASTGLRDLFSMYGVEKSSDIYSVQESPWGNRVVNCVLVNDPVRIEEFMDICCSLTSCSNSEFQEMVFSPDPEGDNQEKHAELADDLRIVTLRTSTGLNFELNVYPSFGWMYGVGSMSYYRITDELAAWLDRNIF